MIKYSNNIIPIMTSNTDPSPFVVSASSEGSGRAYYAIDKESKTHWGTVTTSSHWWKIKLNKPRRIGKIEFTCIQARIKSWSIYGSNDDIVFTEIANNTYEFANNEHYKIYKLNFTTDHNNLKITSIKMFEILPLILLKKDDGFYSFQNNSIIQVLPLKSLTKTDFEKYGIGDLSVITKEQWSKLGNNFEILTWTNSSKTPKLELTIPETKPYKLLDNPSIVTYTEDDKVPILSQTVLAESKVRFLVSKDKTNYEIYKNNQWVTVNKSNIIEQGMTKIELESISQEVWSDWMNREAYKNTFDILVGLYSEVPNKPLIRSITVNYAEKETTSGYSIVRWFITEDEWSKKFQKIVSNVLIKVNNKYYTYQNEDFMEVAPTKENFEQYSINLMELVTPNSQGIKPIMTLDNPEIVYLTDKLNPKLYIKGFRDLRPLMESDSPKLLINSTAEPEIKVTHHPEPQLILPTGDIVLKMLDKIHNFTIYSNKNHGGDIKIIFSVDSGNTWLTYNGENTEKVDISNIKQIKQKGLAPDEFNAIGEKWNQVVLNDKIRFAYYLKVDSINDIAKVDKLEIEMDMHGRWRKAEHIKDYDYEYDNKHIYVSFFKDGSYKINYQN